MSTPSAKKADVCLKLRKSKRKMCKSLDENVSESLNSNINNNKTLSSPPKMKCTQQICKSPSTLFHNLQLEEPKIEPKQLFAEEKDGYKTVKTALHSSVPKRMVGRDEEIKELSEFIQLHVNNRSSGSIYISGPPGTGKTATLFYILDNYEFTNTFKHVYLNCTSLKSSSSVYSNIASSLKQKPKGKTEKDYINCLEKYFSSDNITILILDEIDQLENRKQSILYTLFEWPAKYTSSVILIGIANALDLTDRVLPRLQAHTSLKPKLMHFAPYKKDQLVEIIKNRLNEFHVLDAFAPVAIQMLASKVASVSGDVRRALDIGRRAVELAEQQQKKKVLQPANLNSDKCLNSKIELKDVMCVLNHVYSTLQSVNQTVEDTFPLQQKLILCSLVLILQKGKNKNVTVGRLHDVYRRVCAKRNILAVDQSEFNSLLSLIESRGIIKVSGKKDIRLQTVSLEWNEEEIAAVMKDKNLISAILDDASCLEK